MSTATPGRSLVALRFGRLLARNRLMAGHGQDELARLVGKHRTEISLMERGLRIPRLDLVIRLAAGLEIEPGDLFAGVRWTSGVVQPAEGEERPDPRGFAVDVRRRLSSNLHRLRVQAGLGVAEIARRAALDQAAVRACELGADMPDIATVIRLCGALGVGPEELVAGIRWPAGRDALRPGSFRTVGEDALDAELITLRERFTHTRRRG